ncbi:hypothetical protein LINPERHAP1_LOCUS27594 [Linum perenne]
MNKSENLQEQRRKFSCVQLYKEASTFSQQATCWFPDITNKEHSSSCLDYETAPSSHTQQQGGQGNKDYHDEWKQKFGEDVNTLREIGNERWMPMRVNDEDDNMDNTGGNREQLYFQEDRAENSTSASLQWDDEERNYNSDTNSQSLFRNTRSPTPLNDERDDRVYQSSGVHPNLSNPSRSPSNRQDDEEELVNNPLGDNGTSKDKNILKPSEERRLRKDISESRDDDDDDPCFFNFESEEILFLEAGQDRRAETDEGEREKPECQSEISQERDETPAAEAGSNHGGVEAAGEEG